MLLILFFILILNIVSIALTYYCLSNMEKREKFLFIAIGVAIIYILTSWVYWISTKDIAIKEVSEMGKKIITLLFVPINGIIILPILAKSYAKYKMGSLGTDKLKNRGIVIAVILVILLIIECAYFKDIQNKVITIIEKNQQAKQEKEERQSNFLQILANEQKNEMVNIVENEEIKDMISENQINNEEITNTVENNIPINQTANEIASQINETIE